MFHRTHIYTIHLRPERPLSDQKPLFLREGFSFKAFLLPLLWALYHRLWSPALLLFGWQVLLMMALRGELIDTAGAGVLDLGVHLIAGFCAYDWLRSGLSRKGFILSDVAVADTRLNAEQRYFDRCFAAA